MSIGAEVKVQFGARMKELRTAKKQTQKEIAAIAGVSAASVIAYEKGTLCPSLDVAIKVAHHFGVSVEEISGIEAPKPKSLVDVMKMLIDIGGIEPLVFGKIDCPAGFWSLDDQDIASAMNEALPSSVIGFGFANWALIRFLEGYKKMKSLCDDKTIDRAVFDLWVEKEIIQAQARERLWEESRIEDAQLVWMDENMPTPSIKDVVKALTDPKPEGDANA